ncbi:nitroreductase/quinone reductase family protein [Streptomyces sp. NPDC048723]|uniref:nitroreductase/quinone reductase family protein n=1 Tax=Streptomyces sp. NPDC048723 TaxID=3365589 RepID=UPI00371C698A
MNPDILSDFSQWIVAEFRANGGRVGHPFAHERMILLTSGGLRTGQPRTTPLLYVPDDGGILVVASPSGASGHPDWYFDLVVDPRATVETGEKIYNALATITKDTERDRCFALAAASLPGLSEHPAEGSRLLPVVRLQPVERDACVSGAWTRGDEVMLGCDRQRRAALGVCAALADAYTSDKPATRPGPELLSSCRDLCITLREQHLGRDLELYAELDRQLPAFAPVLARLRRERQVVAAILDELQQSLDAPGGCTIAVAKAGFDRLWAVLAQHLASKQAHLVPALDALD